MVFWQEGEKKGTEIRIRHYNESRCVIDPDHEEALLMGMFSPKIGYSEEGTYLQRDTKALKQGMFRFGNKGIPQLGCRSSQNTRCEAAEAEADGLIDSHWQLQE
jgi:hypothetical protein